MKAMDKERIKLFIDRHICLGTDKEISFEEQIDIQKQLYDIVENYDELFDKLLKEIKKRGLPYE